MGRRVVFRNHEIADLEKCLWRGPGAYEVGVKVLFSAVSVGTESAVLLGLPNALRAMPFYPGYSGCGIVISTGRRVQEIQLGDLVAGKIGHSSYTVVSSSELVSFEDDQFSPQMAFIQLGCIVQQAMRKARIQLGEHVAVVGTGLLGQMSALYAHYLGAGRITLIGHSERGRVAAAKLPIQHDYVITTKSGCLEVKKLAADVVIEAAGVAFALIVSVEAARHGGRIVNLGSTRDYINATELMNSLVRKGASLTGAHISTVNQKEHSPDTWTHRDERELFERLVVEGTFQIPPYDIVHMESSEDVNNLYEAIIRRRRNPGAVLLAWQ